MKNENKNHSKKESTKKCKTDETKRMLVHAQNKSVTTRKNIKKRRMVVE